MKYLYRLYQICVAFPVTIIATIITSLTIAIGSTLHKGHFWGYHPGKWWARVILWVFLIPVKVNASMLSMPIDCATKDEPQNEP